MSGTSSEEDRFVIVADTRRRWTRAQKQAVVAECSIGKAPVSAVARKHNIAPNLLFRWRRDFGIGQSAAREAFVPVALPALAASSTSQDRPIAATTSS
ncbi:MAG TPA: transposase, partial [Devosiaceae bacterium]